jgi:hypothetical protein
VPRIEGVRLREVDPKASARLTYLALGAQAGGPLAIKSTVSPSNPANELELSEPRFSGAIDIPPAMARHLFAGTLSKVRVSGTGDLIGEHIWNIFRHWLSRKSHRFGGDVRG